MYAYVYTLVGPIHVSSDVIGASLEVDEMKVVAAAAATCLNNNNGLGDGSHGADRVGINQSNRTNGFCSSQES